MAKVRETENEIMARAFAAVEAAHPPQHVISNMKALMAKPWPAGAGPKPTDAMLFIAAAFTKATAGCEGGFHALQLREGGCSLRELAGAFDCGPAHNHSHDISGKVTTDFTRPKLGIGRWRMVITPKGEKALAAKLALWAARAAAGEVQPVKGKSKAKAKKAHNGAGKAKGKAKPAPVTDATVTVEPTSEAPQVIEGTLPEMGVTEIQPVELG